MKKRLFFAFSVDSPWPEAYPEGRILDESSRHLTIAFLGNQSFPDLEKELPHFPKPEFRIGPAGIIDQLLFLPKDKPRVVANHVNWLVDGKTLQAFHDHVNDWLEKQDLPVDRRPVLPHITLARAPFEEKAWEISFQILPVILTGIHLYESLGNLSYNPIWNLHLLRPFEEFEHTADIAYNIRGKNLYELYVHGALAMSFRYPPFLNFLEKMPIADLDQVVAKLNRMISLCDLEIGCPFKAVSYHGSLKEKELLHWEMVVDV